ncbi:hypothetical protein [Absidia glauca]|uniref:RING-CH-type domain-containing protein n=1 Tax=Absidia glauca TaxID=4829 RepID=A0A163K796_ABSGL|nr:hypothetical protein [Absidia glauca]
MSLFLEEEGRRTTRTNRHSQPPPYLTNTPTMPPSQQVDKQVCCLVCDHQDPPSQKPLGPYLLQHDDRVYWITLCMCDDSHRTVHVSCLFQQTNKTDLLTCPSCRYHYKTGWRIWLVRVMETCVHLLSLASVIGLVYGLLFLGRSLDLLGLGTDLGTKLDGDEKWQDHEMQEIADWLNVVHLVTALAGEALLGLVYVVGVCWIIGSWRTLNMIHAILYLDLKPLVGDPSSFAHYGLLGLVLACVGLLFGTFLLFYSWIWAVGVHFVCRRILNVKTH